MLNTNKTEWETITYRPQPFVTTITTYDGDKYWLDKGCTIKVLPKVEGFASHLVRGVKVEVTWPEDHRETYVEPLATLHKEFWMREMDEVMYECYPFNGKTNRKWAIGSEIHSLIARWYWDKDWEKYNPQEWCNLLNGVIQLIKDNPMKAYYNEQHKKQMVKFEEKLNAL